MGLLEPLAEEELSEQGNGIRAKPEKGRVEGSPRTQMGDGAETLGGLIFVLNWVGLGLLVEYQCNDWSMEE